MTLKRVLLAVVAIALVALLVVLWMPSPVEVDAADVQAGPMRVTVDDQGETRSHDRFVLSAPVAGRLARIALHDGDAVTGGQVVAEIAPLPLSTREREEIVARVAAADALQREAEQRVRHADEDLAQAQRELERTRRLVAEKFVAPQAAERAQNLERTAASEAEAARQRARAAAADAQAARAGLAATRAGGLVQVRAPTAGRILTVPVSEGRAV
ncbi:MAG TPA: hypothetical protein PK929_10345, partial [Quisquiliibacterium sp.]|nr:hypothetical protein [Quisquiliibacterium sp.]